MASVRSVYRCASCGAESAKWTGRCESCGEWNTLVEEMATARPRAGAAAKGRAGGVASAAAARAVRLRDVQGAETARWSTGLAELDFVLGGGIVPGAFILIGGEPGVGKSTLVLQVAGALEGAGRTTLYACGEESALQVRLRADRVGGSARDVTVLAETDVDLIIGAAQALRPAMLMVDSIQTIGTADLEGAPGNVGQVRESAARLLRFAKETGTAVIVVGHVTKGGALAGPKTLEHIVDTVLYFEGEPTIDHRVLRATKNRFGTIDEIGVFRMTAAGLEAVANPSELFVGDRALNTSGTALAAMMEGSRPLLVEIQALAVKAGFGTPQRVVAGFDPRRLALLLAVLERRAGISFAQLDVFVNVVGGLRLTEPAGDLAVAAALASAARDRPLPTDAVYIGEIGLGGEIRPVTQADRRVAEASNLGLRRAYVSERSVPRGNNGLRVQPVGTLRDLLSGVFSE